MNNLEMSNPVYTDSTLAGFGKDLSGGSGRTYDQILDGLPAWTIEYRTKIGSNSSQTLAIGQQSLFWSAVSETGVSRLAVGTGATTINLDGTTSIDDDISHHIAFVASENGVKLYVDGALDASDSTPFSLSGAVYTKYFGVRGTFVGEYAGTVDELVVWSGEKYTSNFTPPTTPTPNDSNNLVALYHFDGDGDDSANAEVTDPVDPEPELPQLPEGSIAYSDSGILYSPNNWASVDEGKKTANAGAYFRFLANCTTCTLYFDTTGLAAPFPRLSIKVDGKEVFFESLTSEVQFSVPTGINTPLHTIEVIYDGANNYLPRWNGLDTAVVFMGLKLDTSNALQEPSKRKYTIMEYGDSIVEGIKTLGNHAEKLDQNSATLCHPLRVAELVNAEIGTVGWGGTGINAATDVPDLRGSWDWLWSGQPRDFTEQPDLVFWLVGTNDNEADTTNNGLITLNGMLSKMPSTKFLIIRPLNGDKQAENLQYISENCNEPERVKYVSSEGFFVGGSSDGLHPYGYAQLNGISQGIAGVVSQELNALDYTGETSSATVEAKGIPDGIYKTTLNLNGECVFYGDLTYTNKFATATGVTCSAGNELTGSVFDEIEEHAKCAGLTVTTV